MRKFYSCQLNGVVVNKTDTRANKQRNILNMKYLKIAANEKKTEFAFSESKVR